MLRAAKKHSGVAMTIANKVPHMAICIVSNAGVTNFSANSQFGGSILLRKSRTQGPPLTSSATLNWLPWAAHIKTITANGIVIK